MFYLAKEGHQVMLAERKQLDVLHNNHLLVVLIKDGIIQDVCGVDIGKSKGSNQTRQK